MNWVTIDFEASCLPQHGRSFPIEVGICGAFGTASWLIKPTAEWLEWDWTEEAFSLHGIRQELLERQGSDPVTVVAELRRAVGGHRVIADSTIDRSWWQTLLDAADPGALASPMIIEHISDVFNELGATDEQIRHAQQRADRLCPVRHRAGPDAHWLFTLLVDLSPAEPKPFPSWASGDAYVRGTGKPQRARDKAKVLR